jgi:8-amino-7-oxononanoate synthase
MSSLDKHLAEKISKLQTDNLLRTLKTTEREDDAIVIRAGKKLLSFSCNDYLGMSQNRNVIKAARAAAAKIRHFSRSIAPDNRQQSVL